MNTIERAARHVDETAGPAEETSQKTLYREQQALSSTRLSEAADVLLLLSACSLSQTARVGFWSLFMRRLERAYRGVRP